MIPKQPKSKKARFRTLTALLISGLFLAAPGGAQPVFPEGEPLMLSLQESIRRALESNLEIAVERQAPKIRFEEIRLEKGEFDPDLFTEFKTGNSVTPPSLSIIESAFIPSSTETRWIDFNVGIRQDLSTGGNYELKFNNNRLKSSFQDVNPSYSSNLLLEVTQPLLRGFGPKNAQSGIRIAQTNLRLSREAFEEKVANLVAEIEGHYWELVFKRENLEVQVQFLEAAEKLLELNRAKAEAGLLPSMEVLVAEAEVASREENVVVAEKEVRDSEDQLRQALFGTARPVTQTFKIIPTEEPTVELFSRDLLDLIRTALSERPEIHRKKAALRINRIEQSVAENNLYPSLDLSLSAGLNGLGGSYEKDLDQISSRDFYRWEAGLMLTVPIGNRVARADLSRKRIEIERNRFDLMRIEQTVILEVKKALRELETNLKRIEATRKARFLAETKLEAEKERFNLGLATTQDVLDFQKDVAEARINELRARIDYKKSLAEMERSRGTLLDKYRILLDPI